ncbi:hypothetical protein [Xanthomonas oryzae]|uniref:hypothetical protein n=1 Tax=Xanthomonas oryzae TaxID=347 RepID=UPI003D040881
MLTKAGELRGPPLQLDTGQLLKIARRGGVTAVEAVHAWRNALTGAPLNLTPDQWWPSPAMAASRRWRRCSGCCRCCARTMA